MILSHQNNATCAKRASEYTVILKNLKCSGWTNLEIPNPRNFCGDVPCTSNPQIFPICGLTIVSHFEELVSVVENSVAVWMDDDSMDNS